MAVLSTDQYSTADPSRLCRWTCSGFFDVNGFGLGSSSDAGGLDLAFDFDDDDFEWELYQSKLLATEWKCRWECARGFLDKTLPLD